jgi:hypothetical protein
VRLGLLDAVVSNQRSHRSPAAIHDVDICAVREQKLDDLLRLWYQRVPVVGEDVVKRCGTVSSCAFTKRSHLFV